MNLQSGEHVGLVKTKSGFSLSIRRGNSFMSADMTADEMDLLASHIAVELLNNSGNEVKVYFASGNLAEDDIDIVQPQETK